MVKAVTVKRVMGKTATGRGNRLSLVAKAQTLSMRELPRLQEDLVELSNSRQEDDENPAVELPADEISGTETAQQTGEQCNFVLGCTHRDSSGASLLGAGGAVCGAEDSFVEGEVLVSSGANVLDDTSGAPAHTADVDGELHDRNADVAGGVSGAQQVASFAGGGGAEDVILLEQLRCVRFIPQLILLELVCCGCLVEDTLLIAMVSLEQVLLPAAQVSSALDVRRVAVFANSLVSLICHLTITNSCWDTHAARTNSWGTLHTARINSGGHVNSYLCKYNASVGVRRGTKPLSMSTRCQVRCPAVKKPDSLQAPERLHVETWAGRDCSPSLLISQAVEIGLGCADMFVRLPPPFFASVSPDRVGKLGMGWVGHFWRKQQGPECVGRVQCILCTCCSWRLGQERIVFYSVGGPPSAFFVFLLIRV